MRERLHELALFAGGGGSVWASALLGHRVVCAVEIEAFQRSVLLARQRDGSFPVFPVWDDICTFDGKPWGGAVDLVSGGFPCTDISLAGKGAGIDGEKSGLWREMARVVSEVQPRFVFVENVRALVSRGLDRVLGDLADLGFDAEWDVFRASDVGAPHKRERLFILAYRPSPRRERPQDARTDSENAGEGVRREKLERGVNPMDDTHSDRAIWARETQQSAETGRASVADSRHGQFPESGRRPQGRDGAGSAGSDVADADQQHGDVGGHGAGKVCGEQQQAQTLQRVVLDDSDRQRCEEQRVSIAGETELAGPECPGFPPRPNDAHGWAEYIAKGGPQSAVCRSADGLADRSKRLATLGNGWVPQVAVLAWRTLWSRIHG